MSDDYRSMWADLGLDLAAHDMLLGVLGEAYGKMYLTQANRPAGMSYFDFVMSEVHGLRIKELIDEKKAGRKIIGSYCVFVPEEIVLAANATLVGLCSGADFAMEEVERLLPRNTCALIKSAFGFKLGKVCPYLESADMIVGENTCDGKKKAYESLAQLVDNLYVMDLPQVKSDKGRDLLKAEYHAFSEGRRTADRFPDNRCFIAAGDPDGQCQACGHPSPVDPEEGRSGADFRHGCPVGQSGLFL